MFPRPPHKRGYHCTLTGEKRKKTRNLLQIETDLPTFAILFCVQEIRKHLKTNRPYQSETDIEDGADNEETTNDEVPENAIECRCGR